MEVATLPEVKLFNRWSFDDVEVSDISLADYIAVNPAKHATFVPHTAGRYSVKRFRKAQCPIVERLTNSLMMHGRNNGKKLMAVRIVKHAMEIVHLLTDQNPIQVIVDAVINSGPREDATRIGSAGVVRRQAVDISPLRRVNQAIYLITTGARESAFRNIKTIAECLADELINAAKGSSNSYAIKKKDEIERVAKANRSRLYGASPIYVVVRPLLPPVGFCRPLLRTKLDSATNPPSSLRKSMELDSAKPTHPRAIAAVKPLEPLAVKRMATWRLLGFAGGDAMGDWCC
ncbi:ribosomal protein S5 [Asimina triloba]